MPPSPTLKGERRKGESHWQASAPQPCFSEEQQCNSPHIPEQLPLRLVPHGGQGHQPQPPAHMLHSQALIVRGDGTRGDSGDLQTRRRGEGGREVTGEICIQGVGAAEWEGGVSMFQEKKGPSSVRLHCPLPRDLLSEPPLSRSHFVLSCPSFLSCGPGSIPGFPALRESPCSLLPPLGFPTCSMACLT